MNPMRLKIFQGDSTQHVEQGINDWLAINPDIEVVLLTQSESGAFKDYNWAVTITITILYRELPGE